MYKLIEFESNSNNEKSVEREYLAHKNLVAFRNYYLYFITLF